MSSELKRKAAAAALEYIKDDAIVGVGTGSTVNELIALLPQIKGRIEATVASSKATAEALRAQGLMIVDANSVSKIDVYIDGADEANADLLLIKGGGGALTGEKILAAMAKQFICIVDASKKVDVLGQFPLPVEVIPLARSFVARELVKLGGDPVYRQGFVSDYGNIILDVHGLTITQPKQLEATLNQIPGVVTHGLFATYRADVLLIASATGVQRLQPPRV
jgi:ribose 5-phosphate isomerase A